MMGQSLSTDAVSGGMSYSISNEALAALRSGDLQALMASHKSGLTMKLEDEDDDQDDNDTDDDASGDDDGDDESDSDDNDDDDDGDKPKSKESRRIKELSDEAAQWRVKFRKRGARISELESEIEKQKKAKPAAKSKEDDEDDAGGDDSASDELKTENEKLKERLVTQSIRMEFNDLVTGSDAVAKFKNPKTAFKLLDLSEVEIDEDGDIMGLDEAIKALAKSDSYLLDKGKDDDDDDEGKQGGTGQPTGRKRGKGNPNRDKLLDKYPALRR